MDTKRSFRQINHPNYRTVSAGFILLLIIAGCLTIATNTASAATYYLDAVNGNNNYDGNSTKPWKTLAKAKSTAVGGDTVKLRTGNYGAYTEPYGSPVNHTAWITYEAASGHTPVFTKISLYTTGDVNSYLIFRGITVDANSLKLPAGDCGVYLRADGSGRIKYFKFYNMKIMGNSYTPNPSSTTAGIYLYNAQHIIINNCEIYGDGNGIPDVCDINGIPCAMGTYISIGGISGAGCGRGFDYGILADNTDVWDVNITDCNIWSHNTAIGVNGSGWNISNNEIHDMTGDGIVLGVVNSSALGRTDPVIIANNHIHTMFEYGATIAHPTWGWHQDGIQFNDSEINHVIIRGNRIHYMDGDAMFLKGRKDGVYNFDWTIENNLVYDVIRPTDINGTGYSVQVLDCNGIVFRNNTICGKGKFEAANEGTPTPTPPIFTVFANNIIRRINLGTDVGSQGTTINYENNNIIGITEDYGMGDFVWGAKSLMLSYNIDPNYNPNPARFKVLFTNYDANDFTLAAGSRAINFGNAAYAPTTDILGNTRDATHHSAGCYEHIRF
jgi:hypothetical protein